MVRFARLAELEAKANQFVGAGFIPARTYQDFFGYLI